MPIIATRKERITRPLALGAIIVAGTLAVSAVYLSLSSPPHSTPLNFDQVSPAIAAYTRDKQNDIPQEVSLRELVDLGYLPRETIQTKEEIFVNLKNPSNHLPQDVLMRAVYPDGDQIVLLGDGSVQQWSEERAKTALRHTR